MPSSIGLDDFMNPKGKLKLSNPFDSVPVFADRLIDYAKEVKRTYKTNEVPIYYGADFSHEKAGETFRMASEIIKEVQRQSSAHIKFSTLDEFSYSLVTES